MAKKADEKAAETPKDKVATGGDLGTLTPDDGDLPMTRKAFNAFIEEQLKPLRDENQALHKRLKAAEGKANLSDEDRDIEAQTAALKRVLKRGGVKDEDLEDVRTPREVEILLRGQNFQITTGGKAQEGNEDAEPGAPSERFEAWRKAKTGQPTEPLRPAGVEKLLEDKAFMMRGGARVPNLSDADFIKAFADGETDDTERAVKIANSMGMQNIGR